MASNSSPCSFSVMLLLQTLVVLLVQCIKTCASVADDLTLDVNQEEQTIGAADPKKFIVWGLGLETEVVLPARYFRIQAVDVNGNNFTESAGENPFQISLTESKGQRVRVWLRVVDRRDGSYIIQYKIYSTLTDLRIEILYDGQQVAQSPYVLQGAVYQEKCYCPEPSMSIWMNKLKCASHSYKQIKLDLSPHTKVDMDQVERDIVEKFSSARRSYSLCHYVVLNNMIYRKTYGEHVGFKMFMDAVLLSLARKVRLPDFEFFVNLGDWPLEKRKLSDNPLPIFSWCGSDDTSDIVMPTYDVTESTLETMGRVSLDLVSVQGAKSPHWENKSSLAFFRGRDSRRERLNLVKMSKEKPHLIDAKLTNVFFFKDEVDKEEIVKHVSFFDFFQHKYQINVDGTVAAYRFPYLLAGDSLVLKQDSPYYEYFYSSLEPYKHYVPLKRDLSDLEEKIQWARDHDTEAKNIGQAARRFINDNLMADNIFCYHAVLFEKYAAKLVNPPRVREGMELVEQPDDGETRCQCHRTTKNDKEEL